jgi:glycosyltransferase involved in cell wall biosynthesis
MRIALVTYALEIGGVETFLRSLADTWKRQGHEVHFVETRSIGRWSSDFIQRGHSVHRVLPHPWQSQMRHSKVIAGLLSTFDVVLLNDANFAQASLGLLPDRVIAIPVLHNARVFSMITNATFNSENWNALVAVSPSARSSAIHFGAPDHRVFFIPNGVERTEVADEELHHRSQMRDVNVVFIGRINDVEKGVSRLPAIFRMIYDSTNRVRFTIIGEGDGLPSLKNSFNSIGTDLNVSFLDSLSNEDVRKHLRNDHVLVMPSRFEGLSIVLLEAMASGVIPVVSDIRGSMDVVIRHGENGFLVAEDNLRGFAEQILFLINDRKEMIRISIAARETISMSFSIETTAERYESIVHRCLQDQQHGVGIKRTGQVNKLLLEEFPFLPLVIMRVFRKLLRMTGFPSQSSKRPFLIDPLDS